MLRGFSRFWVGENTLVYKRKTTLIIISYVANLCQRNQKMNKALLVGINRYPGNELNGCINDVEDMANFLTSKCNFAHGNIRMLTDGRATTQGIRERLNWLLSGLKAGDRVFFHYSGHGAQVATRNPEAEVDGLDEVICPVDFDWSNTHMIRDKEFNKLFATVPVGVEFVWVSDSCHSGDLSRDFTKPTSKSASELKGHPKVKYRTMIPPADLDWRLRTAKKQNIRALTMNKAPDNYNVALISGCKSDQTSADAYIKGRYNGALTYYLLSELKKSNGLTENLTTIVKNVNKALKKAKYSQQPQLEGSPSIISKSFLSQQK